MWASRLYKELCGPWIKMEGSKDYSLLEGIKINSDKSKGIKINNNKSKKIKINNNKSKGIKINSDKSKRVEFH
jgi:hypothetical protein